MGEPEQQRREQDRPPLAVPLQKREAEPAERELLDQRHEHRDQDPVGDVRRRVGRLPACRRQSLLAAGMKERSDCGGEDRHAHPDSERDLRRKGPRRRAAERE